jgi:uncharacterized membrane protein (DUF106 family)
VRGVEIIAKLNIRNMDSQPFWATPLLVLPSPNSVLVEIIIVLMKNFKTQQIQMKLLKSTMQAYHKMHKERMKVQQDGRCC